MFRARLLNSSAKPALSPSTSSWTQISLGAFVSLALLGSCQAEGGTRLVTKTGSSADSLIRTNDVDNPSASADTTLGAFRLRPEACRDVNLTPDYSRLRVDDFEAFLAAQHIAFRRTRARDDLHYIDATIDGQSVRFRVATLTSARDAGRDLYEALLQHGAGSWGVHRANLAVLVPIAESEDDIVGFAARTKLACWGVLTAAGRDDAFVIPGGYYEP